jgi:hypothetical protein
MSPSGKLGAVRLFNKLYVRMPIRAIFHCPGLFHVKQVSDATPFSIQFLVPDFLIGQTALVYVKVNSYQHSFGSDKQSLALNNSKLIYKSSFRPQFSGCYDKFFLCIQLAEKQELRWQLASQRPLRVVGTERMPVLELKTPALRSRRGENQAAILQIDDIDAECSDLTLICECSDLIGFRYQDHDYCPGDSLCLRNPPSSLDVLLLMKYTNNDHLPADLKYTLKGEETKDVPQDFDLSWQQNIEITLVAQSEAFQQLQIVNELPVSFSFTHNDRMRMIRPSSTFSLLREKSAEPLELTLYEAGWEEYPVTLVSPKFNFEQIDLGIELDVKDWIVGEARVAKLSHGACVMKQSEGDWIVAEASASKEKWLLIPVRPGILQFPTFTVDQQAVDCGIDTVEILGSQSPVLICL